MRLRILVKLLEKTDSLKIRRSKIKRCVRRFIRAQGWTQREVVSDREGEELQNGGEEQLNGHAEEEMEE